MALFGRRKSEQSTELPKYLIPPELWDDPKIGETLRMLGRYASNPDLSFTWYDAAVLSQKIRQDEKLNTPRPRFSVPLATDKDEIG